MKQKPQPPQPNNKPNTRMKKNLAFLLCMAAGSVLASEYLYQSGVQELKAIEEWTGLFKTNKAVNIAIISTGIDTNHEEFDGVQYWGKQFYHGGGAYDTNDVNDMDNDGTFIAGPIMSNANEVGVNGICSDLANVKYKIAKVHGRESEFLEAVNWCVEGDPTIGDGGADIIVVDDYQPDAICDVVRLNPWTLFIIVGGPQQGFYACTNKENGLVVGCLNDGWEHTEDYDVEVWVEGANITVPYTEGNYLEATDNEHVVAGILAGAAARLFKAYPNPKFLKTILKNGHWEDVRGESFDAYAAIKWIGLRSYFTVTYTQIEAYGTNELATKAAAELGSDWANKVHYAVPNSPLQFRVAPVCESK
jgi:subtilisin family serine protease